MAKPGLFDAELTPSGLFDVESNKGGLFAPEMIVVGVTVAGEPPAGRVARLAGDGGGLAGPMRGLAA